MDGRPLNKLKAKELKTAIVAKIAHAEENGDPDQDLDKLPLPFNFGTEEQARAFTHTCFQISPYESYVALAERLNALAPGGLGGTFGGNPVACAAALAVLEVIAEEGLLEKGIVLGTHIDRRFRAMAERNSGSCIGDVRALGCMNAIEIVSDRETREPAGDLTSEIVKIALSKGLILVTAGPTRNVIRVLVPLSTSTEIVDEGLDILEAAIGEAASRTSRSAA